MNTTAPTRLVELVDTVGISRSRKNITTAAFSIAYANSIEVATSPTDKDRIQNMKKVIEQELVRISTLLPIDIVSILDLIEDVYFARVKVAFPKYSHPDNNVGSSWMSVYGIGNVIPNSYNEDIVSEYKDFKEIYLAVRKYING